MQYDVALSFAGEDREYVDQVANHLRRAGVNCFYDKHEEVDLWGKNLYEHLQEVYRDSTYFTVMFISRHYAEKLWTTRERQSAQERAFRERREYILPVRFDETVLPGLAETTAYLKATEKSPSELAEAVTQKLIKSGFTFRRPVAAPKMEHGEMASPTQVPVYVKDEAGVPVERATVLLVGKDGTYLQSHTDAGGQALFDVSKRHLTTVFCAHPERPAFTTPDFDPTREHHVTLPNAERTGSIVIVRGWASIPGLRGQMNPIHDQIGRLYVYTENLSVNGAASQPAAFARGDSLTFEDAYGARRRVTFVEVVGKCFLVEYQDA